MDTIVKKNKFVIQQKIKKKAEEENKFFNSNPFLQFVSSPCIVNRSTVYA